MNMYGTPLAGTAYRRKPLMFIVLRMLVIGFFRALAPTITCERGLRKFVAYKDLARRWDS
jgi:hypothetical protein